MPGGDRTGPLGEGSMTGRRAGYCAGYNLFGYSNPVPRIGRGFGRRRGLGFGRGLGFRQAPIYPQAVQPTKSQETQMLEDDLNEIEQEKKTLEQQAETIKKKLEELRNQQ